jgi:O-acetyl-ADP-ribose deacetylase (regulator of RNase III)
VNPRVSILQGDITEQRVDAIVNAANSSLLGGGGVDGAIHRAAGPALLEECRKLQGCASGEAKITKGYDLPAKWVIHTVGPIWRGGNHQEEALLTRCYQNSLALAEKQGIKSIAFPSISTGIYGFPVERAAPIALTEIQNFLASCASLEKVLIVCFDKKTYDVYQSAARDLRENR